MMDLKWMVSRILIKKFQLLIIGYFHEIKVVKEFDFPAVRIEKPLNLIYALGEFIMAAAAL